MYSFCFSSWNVVSSYYAFLSQFGHRLSDLRKAFDKSSVITGKTQELANLRWSLRRCPILDRLNLSGIHMNSFTINHVSEKWYLREPEFTLREFVMSTWKTFGGNRRNLGSILKETGQEYDFTPKEGLKNKSQMVETALGILAMPSGSASDRVRKSCDGV
ncbi:hypothetical protein Tco_1507779 [Tanacetum coccineum]